MTNLLGRVANIGNKVKQITKQTAATRLRPAKRSMRSHLLTNVDVTSRVS